MVDIPMSVYIPKLITSSKPPIVSFYEKSIDRLIGYNFTRLSTVEVDNSKIALYDELESIYQKCKRNGWIIEDGFKAKGITENSYNQAQEFIQYISHCKEPKIVPCIDGTISFTWNTNKSTISIICDGDNKLTYCIVYKGKPDFDTVEQNKENQLKIAKKIFEAA